MRSLFKKIGGIAAAPPARGGSPAELAHDSFKPLSRPAPSKPEQGRWIEGVDPSEYKEALPLLLKVIDRGGGRPSDDCDLLTSKITDTLRSRYGFTADLLVDINPYLNQLIRDVHEGIVGLPGDREPVIEPVRARSAHVLEPAKSGQRRGRTPPETPAVIETSGGRDRMLVVAICSQKGGVGKTTLAAHLAVRAGMAGHGPVALIDTDPQGSLREWWRARNADTPALATVRRDDLAANLSELRSYGTAITIIDTPPALTASIEQVIAVADLVLVPVRPSPHDLRAVGATVEMAHRAGKPFLFLVNGAAPRAMITAQAVAALSENGQVAPVILYQRTDFAASMIDGRTVMETKASGRSAQEITQLWQHVHEQTRSAR